MALGALATPDTVIRALMAILACGFIPTVIFAWVYEMTPEGVKKSTEIDSNQSITHETGKKLDIATMIMLVSVVALVVMERYLPESDEPAREQTAAVQESVVEQTPAEEESEAASTTSSSPVLKYWSTVVKCHDSPQFDWEPGLNREDCRRKSIDPFTSKPNASVPIDYC